jgi:hypothetical protein
MLGPTPIFNPPCQMPGCNGRVSANRLCFLPGRGAVLALARYGCDVCDALHDCDGLLATTREGKQFYRGSDNKAVVKEEGIV